MNLLKRLKSYVKSLIVDYPDQPPYNPSLSYHYKIYFYLNNHKKIESCQCNLDQYCKYCQFHEQFLRQIVSLTAKPLYQVAADMLKLRMLEKLEK